jgi:hypothetical protein
MKSKFKITLILMIGLLINSAFSNEQLSLFKVKVTIHNRFSTCFFHDTTIDTGSMHFSGVIEFSIQLNDMKIWKELWENSKLETIGNDSIPIKDMNDYDEILLLGGNNERFVIIGSIFWNVPCSSRNYQKFPIFYERQTKKQYIMQISDSIRTKVNHYFSLYEDKLLINFMHRRDSIIDIQRMKAKKKQSNNSK